MDEPTEKIAKEDQESASTANEAFTITRQGEETITLDADHRATTTFTVKSTQPIWGRAEPLIGSGEERQDSYEMPEGLQVDINGVREHEFLKERDAKDYKVHLHVLGGKSSGGGAEQASDGPAVETNDLQVTVDGARPGPYWIRLDMVGLEVPDDVRVVGPKVAFKVPGRPFPWWIVGVAAVVLLIVAIGVVMLLRSWVNVPDVSGEPVANAEATLQAAGLIVTGTMTTTSEIVTPGWVLNTAPEAETRVRRDSEVTLILSAGPAPVAVPYVLGLSEARAVEALMRVGLTMGPTSTLPDPEVAPGCVVDTTPGHGDEVKKGSEVSLVLSSGPEMVKVPEVEGKTEKDAQDLLKEAGLVAGSSSRVHSGKVALDLVIDADPEPGKLVPKGSTVDLSVSAGPEAPVVAFWMVPRSGKGTLTVEYHHDTVEGFVGRRWDFGDGEYSDSNDDFYTYTRDGTYDVTLTITNSAGVFHLTKTDYITVEAIMPVASFEFSGAAPLSRDSAVTFTDTSTEEPTSWLWDFGDGVMSTERSPVHQFLWAGTFPVTLEVTNSAGSETAPNSVTIERPECLERVETDWVSEEDGGPQTSCPGGMVAYGVRCRGDRCDDVSLICCRYHLGTDDTAQTNYSDWSPEYSCRKTGFLGLGPTVCGPAILLSEPGMWLKGLQCRGGYCSTVKLEYLQTERLNWSPAGKCSDTTSLSSTKGAISYATCDPGWYLGGLTCLGPNCSSIRLRCCPAQ